MPKCWVRWRPSGGRGEYEFGPPAAALEGRRIYISIPQLSVVIDAEITARIVDGKPRLRKDEPNNRNKLHLVHLVMAAARLPQPAREDKLGKVSWPLENRAFVVREMEFDIASADAAHAVLIPLTASILHSEQAIDLQARFTAIAVDAENLHNIESIDISLGQAVGAHIAALKRQTNSSAIEDAAEKEIARQATVYGRTNAAAISQIQALPPTPLEDDVSGQEGRILTRLHSYRERDRKLVKAAKDAALKKHGVLRCEGCGTVLADIYGMRGKDRIEAHHRTPIEELVPDTKTKAADLAMVCPNCHDIIHAKRPWISVEQVQQLVTAKKKTKID